MDKKLGTMNTLARAPVRGFRSFGSAALECCYVAKGSLDAYYEAGVHIWDIAAGALILTEAGGTFSNFGQEDFVRESKVDFRCRRFLAIRSCGHDNVRARSLVAPLLQNIELEKDE